MTVTYTKCKNATGYEILLGTKYKTSAGEKYPVKKYVKRTEGKNTVTVTFTNVKKGTWYVTVRSWNKTSKDKSRVYSPYSTMKKFKTKNSFSFLDKSGGRNSRRFYESMKLFL